MRSDGLLSKLPQTEHTRRFGRKWSWVRNREGGREMGGIRSWTECGGEVMNVCFSRRCACSTLKKHVATGAFAAFRIENVTWICQSDYRYNITRSFSNCKGSGSDATALCVGGTTRVWPVEIFNLYGLRGRFVFYAFRIFALAIKSFCLNTKQNNFYKAQ